jgi:hypothetical protein
MITLNDTIIMFPSSLFVTSRTTSPTRWICVTIGGKAEGSNELVSFARFPFSVELDRFSLMELSGSRCVHKYLKTFASSNRLRTILYVSYSLCLSLGSWSAEAYESDKLMQRLFTATDLAQPSMIAVWVRSLEHLMALFSLS